MKQITLRDGCFSHAYSMSAGGENIDRRPAHFEWKRVDYDEPARFYTDVCLESAKGQPGKKVAWLIEPPGGSRKHYNVAIDMQNEFDYILTWYQNFVEFGSKFLWYPFCGNWTKNDTIPEKTKLASMIFSDKKNMPGHLLRHKIYNENKDDDAICFFGKGASEYLERKSEALLPFRYVIVVESLKCRYWFTEKLIDALLCGCVPIYYGCPGIEKFFSTTGILQFNTIDELNTILSKISEDDYNRRTNAIEYNKKAAMQYICCEDWLYINYRFLFESE